MRSEVTVISNVDTKQVTAMNSGQGMSGFGNRIYNNLSHILCYYLGDAKSVVGGNNVQG